MVTTEQEQRRFGLTATCIRDIQGVLGSSLHVEKAVLFGSRATGTYKNGSDLDLALIGEKLTYQDIMALYAQLDELPYAYTYDLIDYHKISNPAVTAHIDDLGITFYELEKTSLPPGWEELALGEITNWRSGGTPSKNDERLWGGSIPWISAKTFPDKKAFDSATKITELGLKSGSRLASVDSILLLVRGSGLFSDIPIAIVTKPVAFNQDVKAIEVKDDLINPLFLMYWFKGNKKLLSDILEHTGIGAGKLDLDVLKKLTVKVPRLETQTEISSILSAFDDKIELNRQMNQTLEAIAQTLFTDLTSSDEFTTLEEYVELNPRLSIKKDAVVRYVEMRDVPESGFSVQGYVDRPFGAGSKFQQYDTLLARITPCLENGKTGFVDFLKVNEVAFGSTEFIVMRAKPNVSPYFVYLLARTPDFRGYAIKSMVGTSGRQRVQSDMLAHFVMSKVDSIPMQKFHDAVEPLFEKVRINSLENQTLTRLRDSLLPRLMSGQIPVGADA